MAAAKDATAAPADGGRVVRRARPLLGTLVEIGVARGTDANAAAAIAAAFDRIASLQSRLSRFDPASEIGRFNAAPAGASIAVGGDARRVLAAARALHEASGGVFDVTLGTGARDWRCDARRLHKLAAAVRLDLGGIAKGFAVDAAIATLRGRGVEAGWVNAGGDLRAFGSFALPIRLRDEAAGGARLFATVEDGAFATSHRVGADGDQRHASVAAPRCLWADALTKIVIATGDARHRLVARLGARAWLHGRRSLLA